MEIETKIKNVDLSFLETFVKGNIDKRNYFIKIYLKTADQLFGELENRLESMSHNEIYSRAHSLKPQSQYIGIKGLKDLIVEIEIAAQEGVDKEILNFMVRKAIELNRIGSDELRNLIKAN